jgi:hypothetical protein
MVNSHAAAGAAITENGAALCRPAKATKAAAPEATEAATTAARRVAGTPAHSCVLTREAAMVAIAKELPKRKAPLGACRAWI